MVRILIAETENFSTEAIRTLGEFAEVTCEDIQEHQILDALNKYDVFWFRLKFQLDEAIINQSNQCKIIICPATGLDHIDLQACEKKGITVLSLKGKVDFLKNIRATAEHTIALSLGLLRHIPEAAESTKNLHWNRNPYKGHELFEKTIGILGVGRLGSITASYFKAFGATVLGYDIKPFDENICQPVQHMNELFSKCDLVSVHVNLNHATRHLVGNEQFNAMKKGSWFINTSRGQIVDSKALIHALHNKQLAAAAVDVIENEFDPKKDILLEYAAEHNNLLITPHIGGNTYESFAKTELFMVEQLKKTILQS